MPDKSLKWSLGLILAGVWDCPFSFSFAGASMSSSSSIKIVRSNSSSQTDYPETQALRKIPGVGDLAALTFVLTQGGRNVSSESRDVGCYLGLRPRRSQSGDRDPQLGITKAGNVYLRSRLKWGLHPAARGGKQARNKVVVAVTHKLAVLRHRIGVAQEQYTPFYAAAA